MFVWLGLNRRIWVRRLVGLLVLVSFCASFVPLPVSPSPTIDKDRSVAFPCQNRPCGCRSAEQCWKGCCCFSNREKLAWAKANRVVPPAYVVAAAEKESAEPVCHSGGCCSAKPTVSCCSHKKQVESDEAKVATEEGSSHPFVIGVFMQKCQGQGMFWNSLPWAILPDLNVEINMASPVVWLSSDSHKAPSCLVEPPDPPPRVIPPVIAAV